MSLKDDIYNFLKKHPNAGYTYVELAKELNTHESNLSKNLNKMFKWPHIYSGLKVSFTKVKLPHRDTYKPLDFQIKHVKIFFYVKEWKAFVLRTYI